MEHILVVPRAEILEYLSPKGILTGDPAHALDICASHVQFRPRNEVEEDPSLKQLIPYLVLQKDGTTFTYRRMPGGGEKRLHNLVSIGVGGHMRRMKDDFHENLDANLERELHEELAIATPYTKEFVGFLNEDFTPVCQVHLGLVYRLVPENPSKVEVREARELSGSWMPDEHVDALVGEMEVWSQVAWDYFRSLK